MLEPGNWAIFWLGAIGMEEWYEGTECVVGVNVGSLGAKWQIWKWSLTKNYPRNLKHIQYIFCN